MVGAGALRTELAAELPAMLAEIERLAAIDSGSYDLAGVDAVADGFGELFAARGFAVTRDGHALTALRELGRDGRCSSSAMPTPCGPRAGR